MKTIPKDNFTGIPINYVKEIKLQEGKEYIEIVFGKDSYETLRITNQKTRTDVFDYLKSNITNADYSVEVYSKLRAGKKPLIAFSVVLILFLWTLYLAYGIESGAEYQVVGEQRSVASIVLILAALGVKKVIIIFASLLAIAIFAFIKKASNPPTIAVLKIRR